MNTNHMTRRAVVAAVTAMLTVAGCSTSKEAEPVPSLGTDSPTTPVATTVVDPTTTVAAPEPTPTTPDAPPDDAAEDAADMNDDSGGYPDGGGDAPSPQDGGGEGGELDPWGEPVPPPGPCDDVLAGGASLLVTPEPAVLPSGEMSSALTITNCADAAVDWTAATIPAVTLANESGNLSAGSSSDVGFTIDSDAYEPGAVEFKIKVSEAGHNHYVDVHAFRELVGSDLVDSDLGLTAGEGAGGCAVQCIVSGRITANATSPDVTMEVGLNTAADITVWVDTQVPVELDGVPVFPGVQPLAQTVIAQTAWSTTLGPLQPASKYHLIVAATDEFDHTSYRTGHFTTITPVPLADDLASPDGPAGCFAQCITTALVSPGHDSSTLHVETHTSAMIDVWVSTDAPDVSGDVPAFGGDVPKAATTDGLDVMSWVAELDGLYADTTYHIIVRGSDLSGGDSYRVGTFHTAHGPQIVVRFRSIAIVGDGDDSALWNPGELSFRWGFGDVTLGSRGEEKISINNAFLLPDDPTRTSFVFTDEGGFIPTLYISAAERDPDGLSEFCSAGDAVPHEAGRNDKCDLKWTVASSGLITTDSFDSFPRCSQFELADSADLPCLVLESTDEGDDYPLFWAVVSFEEVS
jgi:hypothetical protein